MIRKSPLRTAMRVLVAGAGVAVGAYALYAGVAWRRYGQPPPSDRDEWDELLEQLMPTYDVVERRAVATDATARTQFRRYRAFASPGIALIRRLSLQPLKRDAEQRASAAPSCCCIASRRWVIPGQEDCDALR